MSKAPLFDPSSLTLDTLFDASYGTQHDYLYELEAVTPTAVDTSTGTDTVNVRAADLALALSRLDQETFSIVDLLPRNPQLHSSGQHTEGSKKRRLISFPTQTLAGAHASRPRVEDAPISRIAVLSRWEPDFGTQLRRLRLEQLRKGPIDGSNTQQVPSSQADEVTQDSQMQMPEITVTAALPEEIRDRQFVSLDIFDGENLWTAVIKFGDLTVLDSDALSHVYRFLVYGKSLENAKMKVQLLVRGYIERVSDTDAKLHLYRSEPLFGADGVKMTLSSEDPKAFISRLFVASYKRQILTQNLLTNLLYSLRTIQDSTMDVLQESRKLSESAKTARQDFLERVMALINSKKERIAELEARLGAKQEKGSDEEENTSSSDIKDKLSESESREKPRVKSKAKAKAKGKAKAKAKSKTRKNDGGKKSGKLSSESDGDSEGIAVDVDRDVSESSGGSPTSPSNRRQTRRSTQARKKETTPVSQKRRIAEQGLDLFGGWASDNE